MTTRGSDELPERKTVPELMREAVAELAVADKPRRFAIHGTYKRDPSAPILGWGIEFANGDGCVFRTADRGAVHTADNAEQTFQLHTVIGDVQLLWLD